MHKVRSHPCWTEVQHRLPLLVGKRFQVLFHSPSRGAFHLSLTVLVHYRSSSVFSLGGWAPQFHAELACSALLRIQTRLRKFRVRDFHPLRSAFPIPFHYPLHPSVCPTTPVQPKPHWFGLLRFRSPLLTESFLFLRVLRCFSSPSSPRHDYIFIMR